MSKFLTPTHKELDRFGIEEIFFIYNSNNTAEITKIIDQISPKLVSYHRKQVLILIDNCERFIGLVGTDKVGFLTLTFRENVTDHREAYRRFCSFRKHFLDSTFTGYILVKERQKRGAWHFHLLVGCNEDIRTGLDFAAVFPRKGRSDYSSVPPYLRFLWKAIRIACAKYGFGRSELAPIKTNAKCIAHYVSKYISQNTQTQKSDKGVRLVAYSRGWARSSCKISWNSAGAKEWRRKLAKFASFIDCADLEQLQEKLGCRWAYLYSDLVADIDRLNPKQLWSLICKRQDQRGYCFK